jgi:hypothetical protein
MKIPYDVEPEHGFKFVISVQGWVYWIRMFETWLATEKQREERKPVEDWFRARLARLNPLTPESRLREMYREYYDCYGWKQIQYLFDQEGGKRLEGDEEITDPTDQKAEGKVEYQPEACCDDEPGEPLQEGVPADQRPVQDLTPFQEMIVEDFLPFYAKQTGSTEVEARARFGECITQIGWSDIIQGFFLRHPDELERLFDRGKPNEPLWECVVVWYWHIEGAEKILYGGSQ